ncbi:SF3a splicing factor complex subunit [Entophlyctis luteolus]|nr:SF3a splicing factor complex subunit [Entophlyctis luteolus]
MPAQPTAPPAATTAATASAASSGVVLLPDEIIPPPGIRDIADKTARFIAKSANGLQFEDRLRVQNRLDPKFGFLNPLDPYHIYYKNRVAIFTANPNAQISSASASSAAVANVAPAPAEVRPAQPVDEPKFVLKDYDFCHDMPSVSPSDLDILKLTAQFVARNGRTFLTQNHSLHAYFNALVSQYTKILMPIKAQTALLQSYATSKSYLRSHAEARAQQRAAAEKLIQQKDAEVEAERRALAEIDWHDFVVADTIEFVESDESAEFALPVSVAELQSLTLLEKSQLVGAVSAPAPPFPNTGPPRAVAPSVLPTVGKPAPQAAPSQDEDADMDMEDDDDDEEAPMRPTKPSNTIATTIPRMLPAKQPAAVPPGISSASGASTIKIRQNYAPKVSSSDSSEHMQICPRCGQSIKASQMQEHMRIELLDPRWRVTSGTASATDGSAPGAGLHARPVLMDQVDVAKNLAKLSGYRSDIFGGDDSITASAKAAEEAAKAAAAAKDKIVWDGHSTSIAVTTQKVQLQALDTMQQLLANGGVAPVDEDPKSQVGPQLPHMPVPPAMLAPTPLPLPMATAVAPSLAPPPSLPQYIPAPPPGLPPTPASMTTSAAVPLPMRPPPGLPTMPSRSSAPPPPPSAPAPPLPPPPFESELPDAKRLKVSAEDSHLIPEAVFAAANPLEITLSFQDASANPPQPPRVLPVTLPVSTKISRVRELVATHLSGFPAAGKQRLVVVGGGLAGSDMYLKNEMSVGYYNLRSGDTVTVRVQTRGGKK